MQNLLRRSDSNPIAVGYAKYSHPLQAGFVIHFYAETLLRLALHPNRIKYSIESNRACPRS